MESFFDRFNALPWAQIGYAVGVVFGGAYLLIELLVGPATLDADFRLTPAAYFGFVTGGGGLLAIGKGYMLGQRSRAEAVAESGDVPGPPDPNKRSSS